jgi:hypothetical protein
VVDAKLVKQLDVVLLRARAHRNDRAILGEPFALELHAQLDAVHARHVEVEQHYIRLFLLDLGQCFFAIVRDPDIRRANDLPYVELENLCKVHVIIDDQHRRPLLSRHRGTVTARPLVADRT